jgi:hypothetical protein
LSAANSRRLGAGIAAAEAAAWIASRAAALAVDGASIAFRYTGSRFDRLNRAVAGFRTGDADGSDVRCAGHRSLDGKTNRGLKERKAELEVGLERSTNMKRYLIVIAALAVVASVFASIASAHPGSWYWSQRSAANYLIDRMTTSDDEEIVDATCTGTGTPWKRPGVWLFHHLRCDETDDLDREFTVTFHPTSRYHAAVYEVSCDDSYSDTACPE